MLFSESEVFNTDLSVLRLYRHEAIRVYSDKMVTKADIKQTVGIITTGITSAFGEVNSEDLVVEPNLFCHFGRGVDAEKQYAQIPSMEKMTEVLVEALEIYNESNAAMNLVLFGDAVEHVMRITRILEMPRGNCLLIGVGGSGKQSLSRLAAYIVGFEVSQIVLRRNYTMADLKSHLATLYTKAGLKNVPVVFLMTDAQVSPVPTSLLSVRYLYNQSCRVPVYWWLFSIFNLNTFNLPISVYLDVLIDFEFLLDRDRPHLMFCIW